MMCLERLRRTAGHQAAAPWQQQPTPHASCHACSLEGNCCSVWQRAPHHHTSWCCLSLLCSAGQPGQQQQQQGGINQLVGTVLRFALMWYMMSYFKGGQQPAQTPGGASAPLYRKGELVDMYVYISESPLINLQDRSNAQLIWTEPELALATSAERTASYLYTPSEVRVAGRICVGHQSLIQHVSLFLPQAAASRPTSVVLEAVGRR